MSETDDAIRAAMKVAALKARLLDMDWLEIVDTSAMRVEPDGSVTGGDALMSQLREAKPFLFGNHASQMSEAEKSAALAELRKGPKPAPLDMSRTAKQMTPREREQFLREVTRRFG